MPKNGSFDPIMSSHLQAITIRSRTMLSIPDISVTTIQTMARSQRLMKKELVLIILKNTS